MTLSRGKDRSPGRSRDEALLEAAARTGTASIEVDVHSRRTPRFTLAATVLAVALTRRAAPAAIRPLGADLPATATVTYDGVQHRYTLRAAAGHTIAYTIDLDDGDVAQGMLRIEGSVDGRPPIAIVAKAGTRWRSAANAVVEPQLYAAGAHAQLRDHHVDAGSDVLVYREKPGSAFLDKTYRLHLEGLSLVLEVTSPSTAGLDGFAGISLGQSEGSAGATSVLLPYLSEAVALFADGSVLTAYADPTVSSSVATSSAAGADGGLYAHGRTVAEPDTAGAAVPLAETAYLTLSEDLRDVLPRTTGPPSPFRTALASRLVLDAWSLHRSFSVPEGVALDWTSPEMGLAHLTLRYRDGDPNCGNGVVLTVRQDGTELERIIVPNGDITTRTWTRDVTLGVGGTIRAEIDRAGDNTCDSTVLRLTIDTPADLYDSQTDFSGTQGQRGWRYVEFTRSADALMIYNAGTGRWEGAGVYALLWSGGGHPGLGKTSYLDAGNMVRRYCEYGLTQLAILFHDWQRWGFDAGLPDHHPANPNGGAASDLAAFTGLARAAGMLVALHENYTDMYPDAAPAHPSPLWDPSAAALDRNGAMMPAWHNPSTMQQAVRVASGRMQGFAALEEPAIAADYAPNAAFLDVTPAWTPGWTIDHDASKGAVPTLARAHADVLGLFAAMRASYGGPLFGEGGEGPGRFDTGFAGAVDGVERQVEGRSRARIAPDFELLAVKPRMLNHGMGYYGRYFADFGQTIPQIAEADLDQYRASEIAFGHAGFLGDQILGVTNWMRLHGPEYWLLQSLQARYAGAALASALYDQDGTVHDLEGALRAGAWLDRAHLTLSYEGGLTVRVNRDAASGLASALGDFSQTQGERGWRYWEDRGGTLVPMTWDPTNHRWAGSRPFLFLEPTGGHPDLYAPVRTWTSPVAGMVRLRGSLVDVDTACGDGVTGTIRRGGTVLWQCTLTGSGPPPCGAFDLSTPIATGETIDLRIEQGSSNVCDSTAFPATITWDDGGAHDWTVPTLDGPRALPPSGFYAEDPSGFRSYTARQGSSIVDYARSPAYLFGRSRDGVLRTIEELTVDGGIAVAPGAFGDDLHGLGLTRAERSGGLLLACSPRADVNLRWLDARRTLLAVRDASGSARASVTWGDLPPPWRTNLAAHPGDLEAVPSDDDGVPSGLPAPVAYTAAGEPLLADIHADRPYLLRLTSECLAYGECGSGASPSCCSGRYGPAPDVAAVVKDGADVVLDWAASCPAGNVVRRSGSPSDFSGAIDSPASVGSFRDVGAAASPGTFFYLVR